MYCNPTYIAFAGSLQSFSFLAHSIHQGVSWTLDTTFDIFLIWDHQFPFSKLVRPLPIINCGPSVLPLTAGSIPERSFFKIRFCFRSMQPSKILWIFFISQGMCIYQIYLGVDEEIQTRKPRRFFSFSLYLIAKNIYYFNSKYLLDALKVNLQVQDK